ncbi:serine hydrolase [Microbulbifer sp. SH-1]|uniref:serine hydrolase domain-containing protein n=1 Tax=Microbulbifer sp. SH-1 TaxID=2681547 RepID=UPI00140B48D2|nr:serine hydrolase domain-containing protein [Microbulbifer sp. SH-1]QIL91155.1 serine hydrolase [Microbulbifer sp. SH-1]
MYPFRALLLLLALLSQPGLAIDEPAQAALDRTLAELRAGFQIPALAVSVIASGELVYAGGAGYIDEDRQLPVTSETTFRIASISKLFTAQSIMQLVEAGKLKLSDPVSKHLPLFEGSPITIVQLLTHTAGIKDAVRPVDTSQRRSQADYLSLIVAQGTPDTAVHNFEYSDTGFNLLGAIVSAVSGMPFDQYVEQHILEPSHMRHSGYYDGQHGIAPSAQPTYQGKVLTQAQRRAFDPGFYPSEGLVSSAGDLGLWLSATLNQDDSILTAPSYAEMLQPRADTPWGDVQVALAWQVYKKDDRVVAQHLGSLRGYKSLLISYPQERNGIVVLTNAAEVPRFEIAEKLMQALRSAGVW